MMAQAKTPTFQQALDTVERLPPEDQEALMELLQHRLSERHRAEIARNANAILQAVHESQAKYRLVEKLGASRTTGEDSITGLDALQSVQFVTVQDTQLAIVGLDEWETMIEWLETLEDVQLTRKALDELKAAGGERERAGWLKWDEIKDDL